MFLSFHHIVLVTLLSLWLFRTEVHGRATAFTISTTGSATTIRSSSDSALQCREVPTRSSFQTRKSGSSIRCSRSSSTCVALTTRTNGYSSSHLVNNDSNDNIDNNHGNNVDNEIIILFGIGDLRTYDHGGLVRAMKQQQQDYSLSMTTKVRPVVVLDSNTALSHVPGSKRYTYDTATMIHYALKDLERSLQQGFDLTLEVFHNVQELFVCNRSHETDFNNNNDDDNLHHEQQQQQQKEFHVHVCDLGPADNAMGYGAYSMLRQYLNNQDDDHDGHDGQQTQSQSQQDQRQSIVHVHPWTCRLRDEPWENIETLPLQYDEYVKVYTGSNQQQQEPMIPNRILKQRQRHQDEVQNTTTMTSSNVPSIDALVDMIMTVNNNNMDRQTVELQRNTGLFGTHWGGLQPAKTVAESYAMAIVQHYCDECMENDNVWMQQMQQSSSSSSRDDDSSSSSLLRFPPKRNRQSLEHAAMEWMTPSNVLYGEYMTRFLAAPLILGTLSPRFLWHSATIGTSSSSAAAAAATNTNRRGRNSILGVTSVLRQVVEAREWHTLLAARNMITDKKHYPTTQDSGDSMTTKLQYKYWRWHGFLCRYAEYNAPSSPPPPTLAPAASSTLSDDDDDDTTTAEKNDDGGVMLIHGFGASSSQWTKTMQELVDLDATKHIVAPDLIGFGQSEKPPLTYTQYLWESYCSAFLTEVASSWNAFVVGGNSIGGYTSMGVAADDSVLPGQVSASGAPGTEKCAGVILMNSAGQLKTREEIVARSTPNGFEGSEWSTIAQQTSGDTLAKCSPPPRPLARVLGNGLLWYLRPRIQSICKNLYPTNPNAVNEELCDSILRDSLDPGAINVMISGSKLPPPRTANELLGADYGSAKQQGGEGMFSGPVLVAQGMLDPLNDAKMRAKMFGELREGISVSPIEAGHCPHDEVPSEVAEAMHTWMRLKETTRVADASFESRIEF